MKADSTFKNVKIGQLFDFEETGFFNCIKTSVRKYKFESKGKYWDTQVGTIHVTVSNIRDNNSGART